MRTTFSVKKKKKRTTFGFLNIKNEKVPMDISTNLERGLPDLK